jgi:hypothetical protein
VDVQEFMVMPIGASSFAEALRTGAEIFHSLRASLKKRGLSTGVGDEGGFAPSLKSNREALDIVLEAVKQAGYTAGRDVFLALDVAASELWDNGKYVFRKSGESDRSIEKMVEMLSEWVRDYPMLSVILVNFWNNSGFAMILFLAGLESIPGEILESAQIDGANGFQTLRFIKLPLIRYVLLLWLLLNTLGCLNTFDLVYALTRGGPGVQTTIMGIFMYNQGFRYFELGLGSATAVVLLLISFVIAVIYVRLMRVEV